MAPHDLLIGAAMPEPSGDSKAWLDAQIAHMCRALGLVLPDLANPEDLRWTAHCIDRYFDAWPCVAETVSNTLAVRNMLAVLRRPSDLPVIDLDAFAARLRSLERPSPESFDGGVIGRNLGALPLTKCERKIVLWTYCAEYDPSYALRGALLQIAADPADGFQSLSVLLDEPILAIRTSLGAPSRLHALGLVDSPDSGTRTLSSYLTPLQPLRAVLETDHGGDAGLRDFLSRPALPSFLAPEHGVPPGMLDEWFDSALADAMRSEMACRLQTASGVAALIRWSCGWTAPLTACEPFADQFDLRAIQTAVAVLALSLPAGTPLTGSAVRATLASAR